MQLFDTHAHMLDHRFDVDREALLMRLHERGVTLLLEACTKMPEAQAVLALVSRYPFMVAALGTHPHETAGMQSEHLDELCALLARKRVVAVGEIGLDYHYDFSPRETQRKWFAAQLALARQHGLPVVLHVREASRDALDILHTHRDGLRGVMHCFSGSYETAKRCLDMGLYIAFGGAITFRNAKRNMDVAEKIPLDRLLIETDCPYMTPDPHRGRRNEPAYVRLVCEKLAQIHEINAEKMAEITCRNGKTLFGI
ncbi:MAG: TatD family hydrolase [Clostridiales bacterium]|jgi:TatD DNase family protein|nr:TatD family hydrolase [Clostridiales bacterium]